MEEPTIVYGTGEFEGMTFVRQCERCSRYVTADMTVTVDGEGQPKGNNATCARCGRTEMIFIGYY